MRVSEEVLTPSTEVLVGEEVPEPEGGVVVDPWVDGIFADDLGPAQLAAQAVLDLLELPDRVVGGAFEAFAELAVGAVD